MSRKYEYLARAREADALADKYLFSRQTLRQAADAWRLLADLEDGAPLRWKVPRRDPVEP